MVHIRLIELIFREFGDGMQEVRSSILLISTIKNLITTRFMSRVVIFLWPATCEQQPVFIFHRLLCDIVGDVLLRRPA